MKRLSRILCLILTVGLLISSLAVPAFAVEIDNGMNWFNVLNYSTANDSGSNFLTVYNRDNVAFDLPWNTDVYMVDILYTVVSSQLIMPSSCYIDIAGNERYLTITEISDGVYRAYGSFAGLGSDTINVGFVTDFPFWLNILQFNIFCVANDRYDEVAAIRGTYSGGDISFRYDRAPLIGTSTATFNAITDYEGLDFRLAVDFPNWRGYDYIDFGLFGDSVSFQSFSAVIDNTTLPLDISVVEPPESVGAQYYVHMRLDLTGLDRSSSYDPVIWITGQFSYNKVAAMAIMSCSGITITENRSDLFIFFNQLYKNLSGWFTDQTSVISNGLGSVRTAVQNGFADLKNHLSSLLDPDGDNSQGEALKEQGQQMAEYEKQHQDVLQNGVGTLQASSNIGNFATALAFVGNYTTSTFNSLGDYQVVITLPLVIGLILFLASRAPGHSRPRKTDRSTQHEADRAEKPKNNNSEV